MAMPARAFVAEIVGNNTIAGGHQFYAIFFPHFLAIDGLISGIPDAEDHSSLGRAVYLDPEVAAGKSAGFVISRHGIGPGVNSL